MALKEYQRKRRFSVTSEPKGAASARGRAATDRRLQFVVQKHDASHLHYDFRLEAGGVLKSWAVPKGPSLDPAVKSLAVEVEDHPIEYATFEGTIPEGEYGGGTVMLWDRGEWEPAGDGAAEEMIKAGKLSFVLKGERLKGAWTLVRMGRGQGARAQWLLRKTRGEFSKSGAEYDVRERENRSVASGRSMEEIAGDKWSKVWRSGGSTRATSARKRSADAGGATGAKRRSSTGRGARTVDAASIRGAVERRMPREIQPQLATLVDEAPTGEDWIHEVKFDGYRLIAYVENGKVRLMTRGQKDWTAKFSGIARAVAGLPVESAIMDGEAVALSARGVSSFQTLQSALKSGSSDLTYFAFDLMYLNGHDLRACALRDRRAALESLLSGFGGASPVRFSDAILGQGAQVFRNACKLAMEGVVSKRLDAPYVSERARTWVKSKCIARQEMVIGGFTEPKRSRTGFGALLVGYYKDDKLVYAGKVGTGFDVSTLGELHARMKKLEQRACPFTPAPSGAPVRDAHWIKPTLVAEVEFTEWTNDGRLRHPAFISMREDKPAEEVVRERATHAVTRAARNHRHVVEPEDASPEPPAGRTAGGRGGGRSRGGAGTSNGSLPARRVRAAKGDDPSVLGVTITHPDRLLYQGEGIRKIDLALYYEAIAERMLEYLEHRPVVLVRCPQGTGAACFYQKNWSEDAPSGTHGVKISESTGVNTYLVIDEPKGLIALVQRGVLEFHAWGSTERDLERPDQIIFDFDPGPGVEWPEVVQGALDCRRRLKTSGLESFPKFSGGKGLHVVVPVVPTLDFDRAKDWAHGIANQMASDAPDRFVATMSKDKRRGRIFVDYLRNGRGATAVTPYSTRSRPGAPVALPLSWKEVEQMDEPPRFNVVDAVKRAGTDPWKAFEKTRASQRLPADDTAAARPARRRKTPA